MLPAPHLLHHCTPAPAPAAPQDTPSELDHLLAAPHLLHPLPLPLPLPQPLLPPRTPQLS